MENAVVGNRGIVRKPSHADILYALYLKLNGKDTTYFADEFRDWLIERGHIKADPQNG